MADRTALTTEVQLDSETSPSAAAPEFGSDAALLQLRSGVLFHDGTKFDAANESIVPPGEFFTVPAGVAHYTRAGDGEVIYQENGYGPSPTNLLTE